jgi:hypothetical protein
MSTEWIVGITTMILGALLAELLARLDSYWEVRQRADLLGNWQSISHAGDQQVSDNIQISTHWGKLRLVNLDKKAGYSYEAFCRLRDGHAIVGNWRSTRPGANVRGEVLLIVNPQGTGMYGIYSGMDSSGKRMLLGWVLGRNQEALAQAAQALRRSVGIPDEPGSD